MVCIMLVTTKCLESRNASLPSLVLQVTQLVDSYMLWIGVSEGSPDDAEVAVMRGRLSKDWACAMPPKAPSLVGPATSFFRSSTSDVALSMAQRLAKRFKKQMFLSVDVPHSFLSMGNGQELLLEAERGIVVTLKDMEGAQTK